MAPLSIFLALALAQSPPAGPVPAKPEGPVIVFLIDNSASLPPLDPDEKRVEALEKMFGFLKGQPYRLVLFGGRREIYVDDLTRYRNDGQWTDLFFAFEKARELVASHPEGTEFRLVLLTDGIMDPKPADWEDQGVPLGRDLRIFAGEKLLALLAEMELPLYVILVGELPTEGGVSGAELAPRLVLDMVQAANGAAASPLAQSLSSFVDDDGALLKKFVFRVAPYEGLAKIEPIVRRIVAPARPLVELELLGLLVLPLGLFLALLLGVLVRSFPGPGDAEVVELALNQPLHLAVDRMHKVEGGWATTGLNLVAEAKDAQATLVYRPSPVDLQGSGIDRSALDGPSTRLLDVPLEKMKKLLAEMSESGSKEEKIYALNLDYMAKSFDASEAERLLATEPGERAGVAGVDFVRAKAHLLFDDALKARLTEPRAQLESRGGESVRITPGARLRIGRYGFIVKGVERGGRKDAKLVLYYDHVPSLLGLKRWLPDGFQRVVRMRRSSLRLVS